MGITPVNNGGACNLHTDCLNYNNGNGIICYQGICQCIPDGGDCSISPIGILHNECCSKQCRRVPPLTSYTLKCINPSTYHPFGAANEGINILFNHCNLCLIILFWPYRYQYW